MKLSTLFRLAIFAMPAGFPTCVQAAPPTCWPGETSASSHFPVVEVVGTACHITYFCDVGHKWGRVGIYGHGKDCTDTRSDVLNWLGLTPGSFPASVLSAGVAVAAMAKTHAEKDAMWNAIFPSVGPIDPLDAPAQQLSNAVPLPAMAPPSGLVTTSTKTYARSSSTDFNVMSATPYAIPLGKSCDVTQSVTIGPKRYFVVRRADICAGVTNCKAPLTSFVICE